uniref:Uncharacterized protein n=1 Tax=viral metagenome TaxID=1070528 RepID=A0A6H1ZRR6_9ZZZZ
MKVTYFGKRDLAPAKITEFSSLKEAKRFGYKTPTNTFSIGDDTFYVTDAPCTIVEQVEDTWTDDNGREYRSGLRLIKRKINAGRVVISGPVGDIYFV